MEIDELNLWTDKILGTGNMIAEFYLSQFTDDSFGWGRILRNMWFSAGETRPTGTGLLLTGPAGCGKHTAVRHMVRLLANRRYQFVFLDGDELGEAEERVSRIDALLNRCYEDKVGLCLVLDGIVQQENSKSLLRWLSQTLCQYYLARGEDSGVPGPKDYPYPQAEELQGQYEPFFLILIEESEPKLPALLRSRLQLCRMALPDRGRRQVFFENHDLGQIRTENGFLEKTEGLSYAQLEDLLNSLRALTAEENISVSMEEQDTLLSEQLPPAEKKNTNPDQGWNVMADLMERMPEILAYDREYSDRDSVPHRNPPESVRPAVPEVDDPESYVTEYTNSERARLNEMPLKQLVGEVFDRKEARELLRNV